MDFYLTKEQLLLQKSVKEFAVNEIEPIAGDIDEKGALPDDLIKKMARINLTGMTLPSKYGGSGASNLDCILAIEQISYSGTGAWMLVAFTNSIPECIVRFGSAHQKDKYLKPVLEGEAYPSIQFTEAETGSDPDALSTTFLQDKDHYIISGTKRFSTFGARDGYAVIYANDEKEDCTAFIAEKNVKGYSPGIPYELMGGGGIEAVDVYLDKLRLPKENILGKKGKGFDILLHWIANEKIQQCGACVGIAQAALDEAMAYAKARKVRGKTQAGLLNIRSMLADMYSRLEAARWLTYQAAFLKDSSDPFWTTQAAAAKVFVVPTTMDVVEMSRRIHGAYGYTKDSKIGRLYRAIAGASAIAVSLEINRSIVSAALIK
jgi:butyryl-CoA dehydrogenase